MFFVGMCVLIVGLKIAVPGYEPPLNVMLFAAASGVMAFMGDWRRAFEK